MTAVPIDYLSLPITVKLCSLLTATNLAERTFDVYNDDRNGIYLLSILMNDQTLTLVKPGT